MAEKLILLHYRVKSRNRQIVDSATLFLTRVKYKKNFQEQFICRTHCFLFSILVIGYQISKLVHQIPTQDHTLGT